MPRKPKRHRRCCYCGSLNTRKNGLRVIHSVSFDRRNKRTIQRYECRQCGRYFSCRKDKHKHYSFGFKKEVTRMHVEERLSYRVIAKRVEERFGKRMKPSRVCAMVNEIAGLSKSSLEIQHEYRPTWSGYLTIDDKWINIKGVRRLSLVAVDSSGDPIHSQLYSQPTQQEYDDFLLYLRDRLGYSFKAVTTDFDQRLEKAVNRVISSEILHQRCLWHAQELVKGLMDYRNTRHRYGKLARQVELLKESLADRKQSLYDARSRLRALEAELVVRQQDYHEQQELLQQLGALLVVPKRETSEQLWTTFRSLYEKRYASVIRFVTTHWEGLLQHQHDKRVPKTTAWAENINRQLERRLKTVEAFQSPRSAFEYQTLYRNYLRFKPYTDCRGKRKRYNGRSPLEVCGATITRTDWLANAIRHP